MKHLAYPFLMALTALVFITFSACKKTNNDKDYETNPPATLLYGKWELKQSYISTGGTPESRDEAAGQYLQLNADGSLMGTTMPTTKQFAVKDSVTIDFISDSSSPGPKVTTYRYKVGKNKLLLSPPCIEGCAQLYEKVR